MKKIAKLFRHILRLIFTLPFILICGPIVMFILWIVCEPEEIDVWDLAQHYYDNCILYG